MAKTLIALLAALLLLPTGVASAVTSGPSDPNAQVTPIDWTSFGAAPTDGDARLSAAILNGAARYALTVWYPDTYGNQTAEVLDLGGTGENSIRPPASEAFALAVALRTGAYDSELTGVSRDDARHVAVRLAASVAGRHLANQQGGWGDGWQTALWAYYAGFAGWLLWEDLSAGQRDDVASMVTYEADRFLGYTVPYYRDASGKVLTPGDSKAEENSWNADLLQLATSMMPRHPHWAAWMQKNLELMVSAFARPSDLTRSTVVNGKPVKDWLNGSNISENGTLVNHNIVHPDYMATVAQNTSAPLAYTLAGMPTPQAAFWNAGLVYDSLVNVPFASPPYAAPGGTIYVRNADGTAGPRVYYPQGNDWGTGRRMHFAFVDTQADLFGFDDDAQVPAAGWAHEHAVTVREMQRRFADGRTYGAPSEDTYSGREQWVAFQAAATYLTRWVAHQGAFEITNRPYPRPVRLSLSGDDLYEPGSSAAVEATIRNVDNLAVVDVTAGLSGPQGWTATADSPTTWQELPPGEAGDTGWHVRVPADAKPGSYTLTVTVSYLQEGTVAEVSGSLPVLVPPPAPRGDAWVSDLTWMRASNGYGSVHLDENYYGDPLALRGQTYPKGIWTNAPSSLSYYLGGSCNSFTSDAGIDDAMSTAPRGATVDFQVWLDGAKVYDSGVVTKSSPVEHVSVDTAGARQLDLVVTDGGDGKSYDWADWAGARLSCAQTVS